MRTRQPAPRVPAVCRPPCAEEETEAGSSPCHTVQAHERDSAGPRPWHGVHVAGVPRRPHCALAGGEPAFATSPGLRLGVYLHQVSGSRGLGLLDAAASGPGGPAGRQRVCWPCSGTRAAITQAALGSRRSSSHPSRSRGGARQAWALGAALCAGPPAAVRATAREPAENMCARAERHTESPGSGSDPAGPSLRSLLCVFGNTWGPSVCEGRGESSSGPDRPSQGDGVREPVPLPHEPDWAFGRRVRQHLGVPLGPSSCGSSPGRGSASAGRRPRRVGAGASFT